MTTSRQKMNETELARLVERQMRNWEISQQVFRPTAHEARPVVWPFITLSRCVGLPGQRVAALVAERLGRPMFDKEILNLMAGDDGYRKRLFESMDERDLGWIESVLQCIWEPEPARGDYFHRLRSTVLTLARKSSAIFLGRAADLILPAGIGLRVRLQATREYCVRVLAAEQGLPEKEAAELLERVETDRARFIRNHFRVEAASFARHDLLLNMERWSASQAADIILAAFDARCEDTDDAEARSAEAPTNPLHKVNGP